MHKTQDIREVLYLQLHIRHSNITFYQRGGCKGCMQSVWIYQIIWLLQLEVDCTDCFLNLMVLAHKSQRTSVEN